jgi:hypothetical protein
MNDSDNIKFWLSDEVFNENIDPEIRKSIFRSSVRDFVKIIVGKEVPVIYQGNKNFTDGKSITIQEEYSKEILTTLVGIILHESCHIKLSDFTLFKTLWMKLPIDIIRKGKDKGVKIEDLGDLYKNLVNYVEDRYIDNWAYENYIGYRNYYISLYDDFWNNSDIGDVLKSNAHREESIDSYLYRVINLTNPSTELDALTGLREVYSNLDLSNISRLTTPKDRLGIAEKILRVIIDNITKPDYNKSNCQSYKKCVGQLQGNYKIEKKSGKCDKKTTHLSVKEHQPEMESDQSEKSSCLVVRKLTDTLIESGFLPIFKFKKSFSETVGTQILSEGVGLGRILASRWKIRGESNTLISTNQKSGRIDKRKLHLISSGDENLFYRKTVEFYKKTHIHISVDASGSMSDGEGEKWKNAMIYTIAIAKAASLTENVSISVSFRTTVKNEVGKYRPCLVFAYDSRLEGFQKVINTFHSIHPGGETPEGLTFFEISKWLPVSDQMSDVFFINFSDGMPFVKDLNFYGERACMITKSEFRKLKTNNCINSLCYYIGKEPEEFENFKSMYGGDSKWISPNEIVKVSRAITEKLLKNKKIL